MQIGPEKPQEEESLTNNKQRDAKAEAGLDLECMVSLVCGLMGN